MMRAMPILKRRMSRQQKCLLAQNMAGSAESVGITLSLIALVFFVVLVGAVGLGVIGVGYWPPMAD